jgi:hypothetical protein
MWLRKIIGIGDDTVVDAKGFAEMMGAAFDFARLICRDTALDDTSAANIALQCRLKTI